MDALVVVRHGERWDWQHPEWAQTAERPWDTPLSEHGLAQAEEVATFLSGHTKVGHILTSPLIRAAQTALATARATGVRLCVEKSLTEWPIREPLPLPQLCAAICTRPGDEALIDPSWKTLHDPGVSLPTETIPEAHARGRALFSRLLEAEREGRLRGTVVAFGHAASCITLVRAALGGGEAMPCSFPICGISLLRRTGPGDHDWCLELASSSAHLSRGAEHTWSFELWLELERARNAKTPSV